MAPGRSLLREEIRDTLAEAMINRTETKYRSKFFEPEEPA